MSNLNPPIPPAIFRAYDIRGVVDQQLNADNVALISQAIGSEAIDLGIRSLLVARDGRLSSPLLSEVLVAGLRQSGVNVVDLGMVPTPLLYFATHISDIDSGVMLTASHNPANYNGLKIVFRKNSLAANQIQNIRARIDSTQLHFGAGDYRQEPIVDRYIEEVGQRLSLQRRMKIVIDCGHAVPAMVAPQLFERLGCDVIPLYCHIDGAFPDHHPDPSVCSNLAALRQRVLAEKADLGIAFDGDGDRVGVVTDTGEVIAADRLLMLLIQSIADQYQGEAIVFDVKCSRELARMVKSLGLKPVMHKSGHSFMKQQMAQTGAPLGGEYAAHIFIKDRWFGFDDGLYTAARVLEVLARSDFSSSQVFAKLPGLISTEEIKLSVSDEYKFELMEKILSCAESSEGRKILIDGLRIEYQDGWGLVRASNTSPALLLRFEASTGAALDQIQQKFKALIHRADNSIELDF
jgi:phosphomannomutase/phosphoglucomutase